MARLSILHAAHTSDAVRLTAHALAGADVHKREPALANELHHHRHAPGVQRGAHAPDNAARAAHTRSGARGRRACTRHAAGTRGARALPSTRALLAPRAARLRRVHVPGGGEGPGRPSP